MHMVIGVDEAGRGPLAGPVVAAAFLILSPNSTAHPPSLERGIADSKTVCESDRELLFSAIRECATRKQIVFETAVVDHARIDEINILQATFEAMSAAALALVAKVRGSHMKHATFSILVDGNKVSAQCYFASHWLLALIPLIMPQVPPALASAHACTPVIKGDSIEFVIAAASICAKVTRDRIMRRMHEEHPLYNFEQHKGYGTAAHVAAIYKYGPCPYHRMTFAPLKNMVTQTSLKSNTVSKTKPRPTVATSRKAASPKPLVAAHSKRCRSPPFLSTHVTASCFQETERSLRLRRRAERAIAASCGDKSV
jgi:ribonuclease HII